MVRHSTTLTYANCQGTVVGFKLSGPFKFFFDIINVRMTFFDVKGPVKWACDKIQGFFHVFYPYSAQNK